MCFRKMKVARGEGHPRGKGTRSSKTRWSEKWEESSLQGGKESKIIMKATDRCIRRLEEGRAEALEPVCSIRCALIHLTTRLEDALMSM